MRVPSLRYAKPARLLQRHATCWKGIMRLFSVLLSCALAVASVGCGRREAQAQRSAAALQPKGKKAATSAAIVAKAEEVLKEHADATIGAELPVTVEGKGYTARIEEHENTNGDPNRPPGKHKGVTMYER
jgi:hypothetical protein